MKRVLTLMLIVGILTVGMFIAYGQPTIQAQNLQADLIKGTIRFYDPQGSVGYCGKLVPKYAVAAPVQRFGNSADFLKLCGKQMKVSTLDGSRSITVPILDKCFACDRNGIDLTKSAFTQLFPQGDTHTGIWSIRH